LTTDHSRFGLSPSVSCRQPGWPDCVRMSAERVTYLDSSAIVKLVTEEPESSALRQFLRRRTRLAASALAQTEVVRALMEDGPVAVRRAWEVLQTMNLIRVNDQVLTLAGELRPVELRSLGAIHLATAQLLGKDFGRVVTYDERMAEAARGLGMRVASPA
jgi:predicted nucleic acid-binding protein